MNMLGFLALEAKKIDKEMEKVIPKNKRPAEVYAPIWDFLGRGGKRFRPTMCLLSCSAVGGSRKQALPAALAAELFHSFTLLHDDIEDDSRERRGKPCIHRIYGIPVAINSGDALFMMLWEALVKSKLPPEKIVKAQRILLNAFTKVLEGQGIEISWRARKPTEITEEDYFSMVEGKTGALIAAACEAGAFLGGGTKKQIASLREFGMAVGVGFQIQDDVLNIIGSRKKYGKEIGGDISEGKNTLMTIHALRKATPSEKEVLSSILSLRTKDKHKISTAIALLQKYRAPQYAAARARKIVENAKKGIRHLPNTAAKKRLLELAVFFVEREI